MTVTLDIDPMLINPDPRNSDRPLTDDFVQSVLENGVLIPLLVSDAGDGRYDLIAGHRRLAAAHRNGLTTVPVIVREERDGEAVAIQLVENLNRSDLAPSQEAEQVARLAATHKPPALAKKLGKSLEWIRTRVQISKLDPESLAALDARLIPLASIGTFAKLDSAARKKVLATPGNIDYALKKAVADQAYDADVKKLKASIQVPFAGNLGYRNMLDRLGIDPVEHASEPCHCYMVTNSAGKPEATWLCSEPDRHLEGGPSPIRSNEKPLGRASSPEEEAAAEARHAAKADHAARLRQHVAGQINGRTRPADLEIVYDVVLAIGTSEGYEGAMGLLGLDPDGDTDLFAHARKSPANRMKAALAVAIDYALDSTWDPDLNGPITAWLEAHGWTEGASFEPDSLSGPAVVNVVSPLLNDLGGSAAAAAGSHVRPQEWTEVSAVEDLTGEPLDEVMAGTEAP